MKWDKEGLPSLPALSGHLPHAFRKEWAVVGPSRQWPSTLIRRLEFYTYGSSSTLFLSTPSSLCKIWDSWKESWKDLERLGKSWKDSWKESAGAEVGWGHPERKGHSLPVPVMGSYPHTPISRITPIGPPHFLWVSGKCKTGTKVLRKDKGGGRGRWPGFSPHHKGRQGTHSSIVPVSQRSQQLQERSTWGRQVPHLCLLTGRGAAAPGRTTSHLQSAGLFPSPLWAAASARKRTCLMQALYKQIQLIPFALPSSSVLPFVFPFTSDLLGHLRLGQYRTRQDVSLGKSENTILSHPQAPYSPRPP